MNDAIRYQEHLVYRMYDVDGRLLYVGQTSSMAERLRAHRTATPWFDEIACVTSVAVPDRASALAEEATTIREERPLYNVHHNPSTAAA